MKLLRIFSSLVLIVFLSSTIAFAVPNNSSTESNQSILKKNCDKKAKIIRHQDPLKFLEFKRQNLEQKIKEGKVAEKEAKQKLKKIDSKIKEMKKFNKLTVEQKREKLISNFKKIINKKVKEGKLTKEKAEEIIKNYSEKVNKWDGQGWPKFHKNNSNKDFMQ